MVPVLSTRDHKHRKEKEKNSTMYRVGPSDSSPVPVPRRASAIPFRYGDPLMAG